MMKFVKNYMDSIDGVAIFPIISLLVFFIFFVLLFWWVATSKTEYLEKMSHLPLESNDKNDIE
ncbi:CcoQ/FixQ family Cbb3-type cytochrome c oxidase assembly chaperone [Galbibacter sp.]|jgi:hypothetical protein|uniref:CcoQ/FixQ family Cbb3-type cytochrome c oxidase assembly chaperone n=1 Tax=Galbibacter sp. TaxID=2918471 RepID=UPI003A8E4D65